MGPEIERVCLDNEWVIATWSPIHLRTKLKDLYWKAEKLAVKAADFWEDTLRYLYLPRLKDRGVIAQAIVKGAATRDFFGTAYGEHEGKFDGFKLGDANVQFDDSLLLIEPGAACRYESATKPIVAPAVPSPDDSVMTPPSVAMPGIDAISGKLKASGAKSFHATVEVPTATSKVRLVQLAEEIIGVLCSDPNATVKLVVEISADFPDGVSDTIKRAVSENARSLGLKAPDWE